MNMFNFPSPILQELSNKYLFMFASFTIFQGQFDFLLIPNFK